MNYNRHTQSIGIVKMDHPFLLVLWYQKERSCMRISARVRWNVSRIHKKTNETHQQGKTVLHEM